MTEKMTEKKTEKLEKKTKMVELPLGSRIRPLSLDDKMPEDFLKTKLKESQRYIPINLYREILRQVDEFGIPTFEIEKFISGNNKSNVAMIAYKCTCMIEWYKYGDKKPPIILTGNGYSAISAGALLSDAIHGNMHTLQAKALRDALKYSYRLFEFPEDDVSDTNEPGVIAGETAGVIAGVTAGEKAGVPLSQKPSENKKTTDDVVKDMEDVDGGVQAKIKADYEIAIKELGEKVINDNYTITKKDVLSIGTALKEKYGEDQKKFIISLLMKDVEQAK